MANEATLRVQKTIPVQFIVANATGIEKGTTLKISGSLTAAAASTTTDTVAGICNGEKIASDGITYAGVFRGPGDIFEVTLSGSVSAGDDVTLDAVNKVRKLGATLSGAKVLGSMLESGTDGQRKLMEINIRSGNA